MSQAESKRFDQDEMGYLLVEEATGSSPVEFLPIGDRVMIFPVVPDEERPVDIHIMQSGGQDLPDIGVVCAVGWEVNADVLAKLQAEFDPTILELLRRAEFIALGDIVAVNRFSGMDVPGTNFVLLSRLDVLGKLFNFPVVLRKERDVSEEVRTGLEGMKRTDEPPKEHIITASR